MKDVTLSVVHICAIAWLAVQVTAMAAAGNWLPLALFFLVLGLALVVLGCWPLPAATVDRLGGVFAILVALGLLVLAVLAFQEKGAGSGSVRVLLSLAYAVAAVLATRRAQATVAHA